MASTIEQQANRRPDATTVPDDSASPPVAPADTVAAPGAPSALEAPALRSQGGDPPDPDFQRFARAIILGIVLGIPILGGLVALGVWAIAPETDPIAIAGIAFWVALFCGPFLAGTVTVGLSSRDMH